MPHHHPTPDRLFAALGDPTRLAVVRALCRKKETVSALAAPHDMALPSFLQHLDVLEKSGWIRTTKSGRVRTCELDPRALRATSQWLLEQRAVWETRLDQMDAYLLDLHAKEKGTKP